MCLDGYGSWVDNECIGIDGTGEMNILKMNALIRTPDNSRWSTPWQIYGRAVGFKPLGQSLIQRSTQSTDKFLSAVSSNGFGFCSVVL